MADKKISQLTGATTPLSGTEVLPIVQGGSTVKVAVSDLTAGRAVTASSVTASTGSFVVSTAGQGITTGSAIALGFGVNSAVNAITITTTNAVGIGTSAPNGNLTVQKANSAGNTTVDITNSAAPNTSNKALVRFSTALDFIGYETLAPYVGGYMENAGNLASGLVFGTYSGGTLIERMRISAAGDITASTGNLVVGTAGKGIDFSANGGDVLSQYDEGSWTPTITASSGTLTTVTATGNYTRIGRCVTANFQVTLTNVGTASGALIVSLPFTAGQFPAIGVGREDQNTGISLQARIQSAAPTVTYVLSYANGTIIATGNVVQCTITYFV